MACKNCTACKSKTLTEETMVKGEKYNWKGQPERLVYLGHNWSGNGYWHQFAKVDSPHKVWCEVLTEDLVCFEKTVDVTSENLMSKAFERPFRTGDVVVVNDTQLPDWESNWKVGKEHIIREYNLTTHSYATDRGAWIPHKKLTLVRECDAESMEQLRKSMAEEEGENF